MENCIIFYTYFIFFQLRMKHLLRSFSGLTSCLIQKHFCFSKIKLISQCAEAFLKNASADFLQAVNFMFLLINCKPNLKTTSVFITMTLSYPRSYEVINQNLNLKQIPGIFWIFYGRCRLSGSVHLYQRI